ncbi:hypothetical protein RCH06_003056 [Polaromonas sp. CG_9.5]|nr:hypothetical protein [Polaromonas sp. CG_9.5]
MVAANRSPLYVTQTRRAFSASPQAEKALSRRELREANERKGYIFHLSINCSGVSES